MVFQVRSEVHPAFTRIDHRPWRMPEAPWIWRQQWLDLAFLHWPVDPAVLKPRLPTGLTLQTFNDVA